MTRNTKFIGAHVSAAGGVAHAVTNAVAIGANAFALFTRNQRRWIAKPLGDDQINTFRAACQQYAIAPEVILPHASYLINLGHPEREGLAKSREAFLDEMQRCEQLGVTQLNLHPGSHLRQISEQACIQRIGDSINIILDNTQGVNVVLENTAGQGSNLGYRFEQLAEMIKHVEDQSRVGVCIDTCHAFAAGYDLSTADATQAMLKALEQSVGRQRLMRMHLNNSRAGCGHKRDRHAPLGEGEIGLSCFSTLMQENLLNNIPLILETPDPKRWAMEIDWLRQQYHAG